MEFRTIIPINQTNDNKIDYQSRIVLLGSCFSVNIHKKFSYFKYASYSNPFGILFHPVAIENLISNALNKKKYTDSDIFFLNEKWQTFDAHSILSNTSKKELIDYLNFKNEETWEMLSKASHVVITFGTAWVYKFVSTSKIVANCHKVPQNEFSKELLSVNEIITSINNINSLLKKLNPDVTIIFTVSPVRHLKDGFTENLVSKSHLISGVYAAVQTHKNLHYFPSYELMIDDLRDYRFYNEDMIHPSDTAIQYIWNAFQKKWITEEATHIQQEVDTIQKALQHKPFNPSSKQHQKFIETTKQKMSSLKSKHGICFM